MKEYKLVSTGKIIAPFSDKEILEFRAHQSFPYFHEYTCGNCSYVLDICGDYMYCPKCDYKQTWFMDTSEYRNKVVEAGGIFNEAKD